MSFGRPSLKIEDNLLNIDEHYFLKLYLVCKTENRFKIG